MFALVQKVDRHTSDSAGEYFDAVKVHVKIKESHPPQQFVVAVQTVQRDPWVVMATVEFWLEFDLLIGRPGVDTGVGIEENIEKPVEILFVGNAYVIEVSRKQLNRPKRKQDL